MITVEEIRKRSERIYSDVLKSGLTGELYFPKSIRADKTLSKNFVAMSQEIAQIMADSKDRKGFGYTVKSETIKTREHGIQDIPTEIAFETLMDFLQFINRDKEYELFLITSKNIQSKIPKLNDLILQNPSIVISNFNKWDELIKVCDWFLNHFQANQFYIRELPIGVHTKFIEDNKGVLRTLLDALIPDKLNSQESEFEKRFCLRYVQPIVRFRILEVNKTSETLYSDLSVPFDQFISRQIDCKKVIIIENLMNFLTFPRMTNTLAIWGQGFAVENLRLVNWLTQKEIYYWSDLDVQGFQMLSKLRSYFPQVKSILMDIEIFKTFDKFIVKGTPSKIEVLGHLSEEEQELFILLYKDNIRLEQERIPQYYINKTIHTITGEQIEG